MEKMRQQQMSERERMMDQKYKQIMFAEGNPVHFSLNPRASPRPI